MTRNRKDEIFKAVKTAFVKKHDVGKPRFEKDVRQLIELREKQIIAAIRESVFANCKFDSEQRQQLENTFGRHPLAGEPRIGCRNPECDGDIIVSFECASCKLKINT